MAITPTESGNPSAKPKAVQGMMPSENLQREGKATGKHLKEFDVWLCKLKTENVAKKDGSGTRVSVVGFTAEEQLQTNLKLEDHLVNGSKDGKWDNVGGIGYNQQILTDLGIPVKLFFPSGKITQSKQYKAGTVIVNVPIFNGTRKAGIVERTIYVWTWDESLTAQQQAEEIRERFKETLPEEL